MADIETTTAVIVTIGNEILSGKTVDSNSAFIARKLAENGIKVRKIISVSDEKPEIQWGVDAAVAAAPLVICTGGLGPTRDDITKRAVAELFGRKIIVDNEQLLIVEEKFRKYGYKQMPKSNITQAEKPENAILFPNPKGTAPGILIEEKQANIFMLPGVPFEMKALMEASVLPWLQKNVTAQDFIFSRTIRTTGMGESQIAEYLDPVLENIDDVEIAYLPGFTGVDIRLTVQGRESDDLHTKIADTEKIIMSNIDDIVYGFDSDKLEEIVGKLLVKNKLWLALAESFTGGLICSRLTDISGSSTYFESGAVTYSNESKTRLVNVSEDTLIAHGAVSEQVAAEMAEGAMKKNNCDVAISTTGIAGPTGGTKDKPTGLAYIGLADRYGTITKKLNIPGDRERIKRRATQLALDLLRKRLNDTDLYSG